MNLNVPSPIVLFWSIQKKANHSGNFIRLINLMKIYSYTEKMSSQSTRYGLNFDDLDLRCLISTTYKYAVESMIARN